MGKPSVLLAEFNGGYKVPLIQRLGWGRMYNLLEPRPYAGEPWALDNGAWLHHTHGTTFDSSDWLRRVDRALGIGAPFFFVVPDIVQGGRRSLEFSLKWQDATPRPRYLATQDGMTYQDIISVIDGFDGLFLGGSAAWKLTARDQCDLAHRYGKRFHFARCGTEKRLLYAIRIGADSLDSSFPLWTRKRMADFEEYWKNGHPNREFDFSWATRSEGAADCLSS